ncbi:hypothetical protein [Campylobacter ureolyticus]|uniref:hypothetical protein n=1 Tax=Campylobacter ureolyticus TaxID=827 RepID=UPI0022B380A2|nr:hypothetical protein [Campylobacter ureolyticus]MCZ6116840.1 hypothetical protein [Campylobacter ureolyticus]
MTKEFINLLKIYLILDFILAILSFVFGLKWLISSQISFIITMFIANFSFKSYKNMIDKELRSGKFDYLEENDEGIKISKKSSALTFLSPFKIVGYFALGLSFYILVKTELLNVYGFMAGVFPYPIGAMIYGILYANK